MATFRIEWHEEGLSNAQAYAGRLRAERDRLNEQIARLDKDNDFRAFQISEARRQGKTHFDPDRFCKRKEV